MGLINTFILWSWLLGISLLVPTALPAGGAQKSIIETRENSIRSPLIAFKEFNLLSTINDKSTILTRVESGTPVDVLKVWQSPESGTWLLVYVLSQSSHQIFSKRGWVSIGS
tara:strand:- start:1741 stop:2076 length:336 start_codon:yes stop_codon:yes gene_type:complete